MKFSTSTKAIFIVLSCSLLTAAHPPMVINNPKSMISRLDNLKIKFDELYSPSETEALLPRNNLPTYLESRLKTNLNPNQRDKIKSVIKLANQYEWFVAGYSYKSERFLYCYATTLFLTPPFDYPEDNQEFPIIKDGGTKALWAIYNVSTHKFIYFRTDGVA